MGYVVKKDNLRGVAGVLLAFLTIFALDQFKPDATSAPDFECGSSNMGKVSITVQEGESGASIAADLAENGVIKSATSFFRLAVGDTRAASIAPGVHEIDLQICAVQALEQLLDSERISNLIAINEGAWISEIKARFKELGYTNKEIEEAFSRVSPPAGFTSLEGLLFPAQYSFEPGTPLKTILSAIVERGVSEINRAGIANGTDKFTSSQLLTIASLIEAEADPIDYGKVSQVVRNRLSIGMPLQFDSTVHYIMNLRGSIFLSTKSTFLKSPYNTYRNYGLPPTPINNPGRLAMEAALRPEPGDWLYFITVAPGDTRFTSSFAQFGDWKILYKENLKKGKFE
jgi:UPF0755 protein